MVEVVDVVLDPSGSSAVDEVVVDEASLGATVASGSTIPVTTACSCSGVILRLSLIHI